MTKKVVAEGAILNSPYSPAVTANGFCFLAGHLGVDSDGNLVDGLEAQIRQTLENLTQTLQRAGLERSDVVRTSLWVRDYAAIPTVNRIYSEYFPTDPPARTAFETNTLPMDALFEIDGVAAVPAAN